MISFLKWVLPAKHAVYLRPLLWKRSKKRAIAKSKYHLFGSFYCAELKAVCKGVKRNEILL